MSTDRAILLGVGVLALIAAFWFMILAPKRNEASQLQDQVVELQAQVSQTEAEAAAGQQAKSDFPVNYKTLVSLGKAVPTDADTPSLLTQLQTLSTRADVHFQSISLSASAAATPTPAAPPVPAVGDASEATAALLPIGATVGAAGLPVMPYSLEFHGGFFEIADFFGSLDGMVDPKGDGVGVDGRLLTIDGFSLTAASDGFPNLKADVEVSSYLTPKDEGITAGASPTGPAPAAPVPAAGAPPADPGVAAAVVAN